MNFKKTYEKYVEYVSMKLKPTSISSITSRFNSYILPYFKDYNIEDITPIIYLKWQDEINEKRLSYRYKKSLHYSLVSFYSYLDLFLNYKNNIPKKVGNFRNDDIPKEIKIWNYEEFKKFINSFSNEDFIYKVFFVCLFHTGCRLGECLALTFNDLNDNSIFINKTISKEKFGNDKLFTTPKTKNSIRHIKIDNYLIELFNLLKEYYFNKFGYFDDDFYIFGGIKTLSISSIERRKKKYTDMAGLDYIRINDFRHSNATFLIQNNIPIIEVSRRLGHSDINITIKTYTHLTNEYEKKVLDTFNSIHNYNI